MEINKKRVLAGLCLGGLLTQGCATLEPETEADWQSVVEVSRLAETHVSDDGSRLVVGNPRNLNIIDGHDGQVLGGFGEAANWQMTISVGGTEAYRLRAESSNALVLPEADLALMFDYHGARERITAVHLSSGDKAWHSQEYNYSLQQYEQIIGEAVDRVAAALGGEGESTLDQRKRQRHFAQHLARPVDDGEGLLLKTFDGLIKLDASTGFELWRLEDFQGPGIRSVETLDNGDYLVLSTGRDLSRLQAAESYHLARISPDGEVRWKQEHSGRDTHGMQVAEGYAVIDASPMQVFQLNDGSKAWEGTTNRRSGEFTDRHYLPAPEPAIRDGVIYHVAWTHGEDGDLVSVGAPHRIRALDLSSGDILWESEETSTYFGDLKFHGDQLIAWGAGRYFGDSNVGGAAGLSLANGEELWRTAEMETPGLTSAAPYISEPIVDGQRNKAFVAGPEVLYAVDLNSNEIAYELDLNDMGFGDTMGLMASDDRIAIIHTGGVAAINADDGTVAFDTETEHVGDFHRGDERVVVQVLPSALMAFSEDDNSGGLRAVDLRNGETGPLVAWEDLRSFLFGSFDDRPVVSTDGRAAFFVDEDGQVFRYRL
ncbi:PQQ-binding-like beta-propeller repeat protein [Natronospira sp.]|uniref:outer membrane protein assembly factor BamB family protein n=1 Tax=Natronospira sp. TaxID=2024970 RepID=UPI0038734E22